MHTVCNSLYIHFVFVWFYNQSYFPYKRIMSLAALWLLRCKNTSKLIPFWAGRIYVQAGFKVVTPTTKGKNDRSKTLTAISIRLIFPWVEITIRQHWTRRQAIAWTKAKTHNVMYRLPGIPFLSRVRRFGDDFHKWRSHEGNHFRIASREKKINNTSA